MSISQQAANRTLIASICDEVSWAISCRCSMASTEPPAVTN